MIKRYAAPIPEVHYIPSLFRKIQNGEIRIPAFQRGYVWKEKNILELMESIFLGYPIGSLLFWRTLPGQLREVSTEVTSFPSVETKSHEVLYVLDGMQRISTLYGAFHKAQNKSSLFRIAYNFVEERFYLPLDEALLGEGSILLESIFNPRELLAFQSQALMRPDGDTIVAKSIELQSIFQEYLIPTVTINERGVPDVVEIFSRVNSTGVKLDVVDFMRALTWSDEFDLTEQVEKLREHAKDFGFDLEGHTFVKLIALCAGFQTTADSMYQMSGVPPSQLHRAVDIAAKLVPLTIDKIKKENRIVSSSLLGYEGQFLIWAAALMSVDGVPVTDFSSINKLVWRIGFGELLRGKADHFLDRILQKVLSRQWEGLGAEVRIGPETLLSRRFLNGRALSSTLISMYYERVENLRLQGLISENFEFDGVLYPAFRLDRKFGETRSDKIFANLILGGAARPGEGQFSSCQDLYDFVRHQVGERGLQDWLLANFIDIKDRPREVDKFLISRADAIYDYASTLMG